MQALIGSVVLGDFHLSIRGSTVIRMFFLHTYILYIDMFDCTKKSKQLQTGGLNKTNNTTSLHIYEINIFPNLFSMSLNIFFASNVAKIFILRPMIITKMSSLSFCTKKLEKFAHLSVLPGILRGIHGNSFVLDFN